MENLGRNAKDIITGFEGVITQKVFHVTGCVQYGLRGKAINNEVPRIHLFDISRIDVYGVAFESMQKSNEL